MICVFYIKSIMELYFKLKRKTSTLIKLNDAFLHLKTPNMGSFVTLFSSSYTLF